MLRFAKFPITAAVIASLTLVAATPASAACKKMGFLVNDYGKDGPTKDAQKMLDKHIAKWADEQGIVEYSVGKKSVKCELFLNLILFDEHTCTASATVCWGGGKQPKDKKTQTAKSKNSKSSKSKAVAKKSPAKSTSKVVKTVAKTPDSKKTPATTTAKAKTTGTAIETSAIPRYVADPEKPIGVKRRSKASEPTAGVVAKAPVADDAMSTTDTAKASIAAERDAADRAAAAAERAAAAAEKAAKAAQLAAEAAKQAAAVSQMRSTATVPPVTPKQP